MQTALGLAESETDFKIKVERPGVQKENITLEVTKDNQLVIIAEQKTEKKGVDEKARYHRGERLYGATAPFLGEFRSHKRPPSR